MKRSLLVSALLAAALVAGASAGADTYPRQEGVDVLDYVFRLALGDDTDVVAGLATVDLRLRRAGVAELALDLVGPASGAGDAATGMHVSGAWVVAAWHADVAKGPQPTEAERGAPASFEHVGNRLRLSLPANAGAGDRLLVTVAYSGVPATGLQIGLNKHGDRGFFSDNWPTRARHWLPLIDHVYEKARSQMIVTAPDHYQVISNGLLVEETDLGDGTRRTWWKQGVPIAPWLYVLGAARFAVQHLPEYDGKPVQTWVYPQDRAAGFHDFAVPTHDVLAFYEDNVGPFAYEKLANIQSNSVGGGMESASAIFYGDNSVTGTRSVRWRNVVIHEIAHQWFGNAVTEADWDDVWLSEGFATYFTLLYREHAYGRDDFVAGLRQARASVLRFYEQRPEYRIVHENLDDMSQVTTGMQYQKGAWTLHMLRGLIGTEAFWRGIRSYYAEHFNGHATTADFRRHMEEASGQSLQWFFDQWLRRGGVPRLQASWSQAEGEVRVQLRQTQDGQPFRMPLQLELRFADGTSARHEIELNEARGRFRLQAPQQVLELVVDPDTWGLLQADVARESTPGRE